MTDILRKIASMPSGSTSPLDYLLAADAETPFSRDIYTVYAVSCETSPWTKIGFSNCADTRLRELQVGCPYMLSISAAVAVAAKGRTVERATHRLLDQYKKHGEWFDVSPLEAAEAILKACKQNHVQHWPLEQVYQLEREAHSQIVAAQKAKELRELRVRLGME